MLTRYDKFLISLLGAIILWASTYYGAHNQWVQVVIAVLTAAGVYVAPNKI